MCACLHRRSAAQWPRDHPFGGVQPAQDTQPDMIRPFVRMRACITLSFPCRLHEPLMRSFFQPCLHIRSGVPILRVEHTLPTPVPNNLGQTRTVGVHVCRNYGLHPHAGGRFADSIIQQCACGRRAKKRAGAAGHRRCGIQDCACRHIAFLRRSARGIIHSDGFSLRRIRSRIWSVHLCGCWRASRSASRAVCTSR